MKACEKFVSLTAAALVLASTAGVGYGEDATEKLKIELPKPMFVGTPKNIVSPNLAPAGAERKLRETFMVPQGTVNVASKKPVTSSDMAPIIGELALVTDGDKEGADGSYVELGPGKQWVQIDLEKPCKIYGIVIWHFHAQARVVRDTVVQVADDPDFITNVRTVLNNDHDNTSGLGIGKDKEYIETNEGKLVDAKGEKARYVRLHSNGSTSGDLNHYVEVEVFGKPAE